MDNPLIMGHAVAEALKNTDLKSIKTKGFMRLLESVCPDLKTRMLLLTVLRDLGVIVG